MKPTSESCAYANSVRPNTVCDGVKGRMWGSLMGICAGSLCLKPACRTLNFGGVTGVLGDEETVIGRRGSEPDGIFC